MREWFPDVAEAIPALATQFFARPANSMLTIRCAPWSSAGRVLLVGDAAHAVLPFYGQGANAGFEGCATLDRRGALVNRSEVWWVEDPELGRRPHLILTRDAATPVLRRLLSVPATRTVRGIPTEVRLGPEDGMPAECVLSLDNITAIPRALFVERICRLAPDRMHEVCAALGIAPSAH